MSLIWGLTWAAIKIGLAAAPPLFLAAARYLIAAAVLAFLVCGDRSAFVEGRAPRTLLTALLVNVCTHGLLFWGMQHVASGLAGLINLALIPVMLFALAALTGEQRAGWRHALALAIGCAGLVGLFWTRLRDGGADGLGMAAVVAATACYCIGSILARPLIGPVRPLAMTFAQAATGGAVLLALSLALEPVTGATLAGLAMPRVIASLLVLSLLGTIIAYTIYLVLIREWGTVRAGLYAFVSPIVALAIGAGLFGEAIGWPEISGALLLLTAAAIALAPPRETGSG
ncbi:drug/metabolite transporter (DMT)-like permease [Sphingopyxis sp. OAS728]|uniref:DMT family transporter n=1 Tax=Sphingopyxis sp. OAS728 TaxID=2663823 RepID=UPI001789CC88|nr:DMT family transporter [Sphingopyxis sp. OAS728]MBE1528949.1 drug/metabolite transporter (DMT)-like permease [Sphingopyxis sp. OAS728]